MHLHAIDYVLWFSGIALQIGILLTIYARGLYREYPFFTLYQLVLARIIHEGTESGSLGGVCALRMVVAA